MIDWEPRFWGKVQIRSGDACWSWLGGVDQDGYGRFYPTRKRPERAHRLSVLLTGREIPEGMVVDHACRNRTCVNPDHLRVVTRLSNVHENSEAPAHLNSQKTHCLRGHPLEGANLHVRKNGKRECLKCAADRERTRYHAKHESDGAEGNRPTLPSQTPAEESNND